jgi:hypothetical protein
MIPLNQIQVVEYSVNQGCYHVETMDEMLKTNLRAVSEDRTCDYMPIGFFDNYDAASNFIEWHRKHKGLSSLKVKPNGEIGL